MNKQFHEIDLKRWLKMFQKKFNEEWRNKWWLGWINKGWRNKFMGKKQINKDGWINNSIMNEWIDESYDPIKEPISTL